MTKQMQIAKPWSADHKCEMQLSALLLHDRVAGEEREGDLISDHHAVM